VDPNASTVTPTAVLDPTAGPAGTDVQQVTVAIADKTPAAPVAASDATIDLATGAPAAPASGPDPTLALGASVAFNEPTVRDEGAAAANQAAASTEFTLNESCQGVAPEVHDKGSATVAERDVTLDLEDATANLAGVPGRVTRELPPTLGTANPDRPRPNKTAVEGARPTGGPEGAAKTRLDPATPLRPGNKRPEVAGYEILEELGRGGMGVVYKARQPGLNRMVALKMILRAGHVSAADLVRFRMEAEAVAQLQHPNIVQIYEVGDQDGCPFFSLEFVEGQTLADQIGGVPQSPRFAAEITRDLARAMDQAHRRGIIHRDLKPANVLLTNDGTPKITDFGLAKRYADDDTGQTRTGAIMGTPSYMAPEQAAGKTKDTGPAADIYSLGAILYDLLAGRPPFRGVTVLDTLQQVRSLEPVPPRRLDMKVPRDLETICLKCLQKEPSKRYANAGDLAEDLRRFLAGEPIQARPTPLWERGVKWARRHPAAATLIGVSTVAAVSLLVVGGLWLDTARRAAEEREQEQAERADLERQRAREALALKNAADQARKRAVEQQHLAEQAQQKAQREYQRAEANFRQARAAVDQMLTGVGQVRLAHEPRMEQLRRDLLTRALGFYERFLTAKGTDPSVRAETARARERVADIQKMLGKPDEAEKAYRAALDLFRELPTGFAGRPECRRDLAICYNNLGNLLKETGRQPQARTAYGKALALRQRLAAEFPADPDYRQDLSDSYDNLGAAEETAKRLTNARDNYGRALALQQQLTDEFPNRPSYHRQLARRHNNLGQVLGALDQVREATQHFHKAQAILQKLVGDQPPAPEYRQELAASFDHMGYLERSRRPRAAEVAYRRALDMRQALTADYPGVPSYREELAEGFNQLAVVLQARGRRQEADAAFGKALAIQEKLAADFPRLPEFRRKLGSAYNNRGNLLLTAHRLKDAERFYDRALGLFSQLAKEFPSVADYQHEQASTQVNLGVLWYAAADHAKAEQALVGALALQQRLADRYPSFVLYRQRLATTHLNLGLLRQLGGKLVEAGREFQEMVAIYSKLAKEFPDVPEYAHQQALGYINLGNLLRARKRPKDAEAAWHRALDLLAKLANELAGVPMYRQDLARAWMQLAVFLGASRRTEEAEQAYGKALALREALAKQFPRQGAYRQELATTHSNLAVLWAQANRPREAETSYRKALALLEALVAEGPVVPAYYQELIVNYTSLANLLEAQGRSGAEKSRRRVQKLQEKLVTAYPKVPAFRHALAGTLTARAKRLLDEDNPAQARPFLEGAARHLGAAVELSPREPTYRRALRAAQWDLANALLTLKDHAGAGKVAKELAAGGPNKRLEYPRVAGVLARCAGLATADNALAGPKRKELAQAYGTRAVELLGKAVAAGFQDAKYLKETADLQPLRERADFKKLVSELDARAKGPAKSGKIDR
jgi:serine/threonine protein kinase/tetratricopeptide (TPR) repeat protein